MVHRIASHTVAGLLAVVTGMTVLAACGSEDDVLRRPDGQPISTSTTRIAEVNLVNPERNFTKTCSAPTAPDAGRPDVERIAVTDPAAFTALVEVAKAALPEDVNAPSGEAA